MNCLLTDGRTDKKLIGRSLSTSRLCVEIQFLWKKYAVPKAATSNSNTYCFPQLSRHLSPRHNGKYNICAFGQEIQVFEDCRDRFVVKSIDFDRFIASESADTLILALTSKTGQSVAHNRRGIFLFRFCCQREDTFGHSISLISDSRLKKALEIELNKDKFYHFFIDFTSAQPAPVLGNTDLR